MTEADVEWVYEIETKVFANPWSKGAFSSDLKSDYAYPMVARVDDKVAGYACVYKAGDEIQIGNLAVAPDYHQRGIASKLLEQVIEFAKENHSKVVVLEVRQSNQAARRLYLKFGFKEAGKRKYYYRRPTEDALIMVKGVE